MTSHAVDQKKSIGARIQQRRQYLGFTQQDVANKLHMKRITYAQYEHGRSPLAASEMPRLAEVLHVPVAYFFDEEAVTGDVSKMPIALQEALAYAAELLPDQQILLYETWKQEATAMASLAERRRQAERDIQEQEKVLDMVMQATGVKTGKTV